MFIKLFGHFINFNMLEKHCKKIYNEQCKILFSINHHQSKVEILMKRAEAYFKATESKRVDGRRS